MNAHMTGGWWVGGYTFKLVVVVVWCGVNAICENDIVGGLCCEDKGDSPPPHEGR